MPSGSSAPSFIFALSDYVSFSVGRRDSTGEFIATPDIVSHSGVTVGSFVHGAELARFTLNRPEANVQVKYDSPLYIAFGKPYESIGNAVDVLSGIHRHIEQEILPEFVEFF